MDKKLIALISRQRCGTNALRAVLSTHPDIHCFEEVLNNDEHYLKHEWSYFRFVQENYSLSEYHPTKHLQIFSDFVKHLHTLHDKPQTLIDLKLNTCPFIGARFVNISSLPIFNWLKDHRHQVIHLKRSNFLRVAFSIELAEARGVWHDQLDKEQTPAPQKVTMDRFEAKWLPAFHLWSLEDNIVELNFPSGRLELEYGNLYPNVNTPICPQALEEISAFLDVENQFTTEIWCSKSAKRPLRDAVANWTEVCGYLKGTDFEFMLDDEPMYRGISEVVDDDKSRFKLETASALLQRISA